MSLTSELALRTPSSAPLARAVRRFAGSRVGAALIADILPRIDRWVLRLTGRRTTVSDLLSGAPTLFLTTTGARTGLPRTAQMIAIPFGGDVAVFGSNFGRRSQPGWVSNLAADPRALASRGRLSVQVVARELTGAEAERAWAAGRAVYHGFTSYPGMTGGRTIRVFLLQLA